MAAKNIVFNYEKEKIDLLKKIAKKKYRTISGMTQTVFLAYLKNPINFTEKETKKKKKKIKITTKKRN